MAPSISAGFSHMEMAGDEGIEARRGGGSLRGERGDFVSLAFSLQRLVVKQCINGAGCLERAGIGPHRVSGVPIIIERVAPCSARTSQIALRPHESKSIRGAVGRKPTSEHAQIGLFGSCNLAEPDLLIQRTRVDVVSADKKAFPFENCATRAHC
jgi:hypothetical protein